MKPKRYKDTLEEDLATLKLVAKRWNCFKRKYAKCILLSERVDGSGTPGVSKADGCAPWDECEPGKRQ